MSIFQPLISAANEPSIGNAVAAWWTLAACGVAQLLVSATLCIPLENRWAFATWEDRHPIWVDVAYAFFVRIVLFPAIAFFEYSWLLNTLHALLTGARLPASLPDAFGINLFVQPAYGFVVALCLLDLADYWRHRLSHRYGWWYGIHSLHHAEDQMTFWSDDRSHLLEDAITYVWLIALALVLGMPAHLFPFVILAFRLVGSVAHANTRFNYGWLGERILVSPQFHRAHHALQSAGHRSCNYGTMFPWWDMAFGTADFRHDTVQTGDASAPEAMVTGSWGAQQIAGLHRMVHLGRRRRKPTIISK